MSVAPVEFHFAALDLGCFQLPIALYHESSLSGVLQGALVQFGQATASTRNGPMRLESWYEPFVPCGRRRPLPSARRLNRSDL